MFEPVPAQSRLELNVFGQEGPSRLTGQVTEINQLHTPTAEPVYIAHIALSPGAAQYTQKRISFLRTATTSVLLLFVALAFLVFTIFPTASWGRDWLVRNDFQRNLVQPRLNDFMTIGRDQVIGTIRYVLHQALPVLRTPKLGDSVFSFRGQL